MSTEINNSDFYNKVMNFLKRNQETWFNDADENKDGKIINSEFSNYLLKNIEWDGLENKQKKDLIDKFWDNFDTNTSASKIDGTNLRNINALDNTEQNVLEGAISAYEFQPEADVKTKIPDSMEVGANGTYDFGVVVKDKQGETASDGRVTLTVVQGNATIQDGKITITAPGIAQNFTVSVEIKLDDVVVRTYTKTIAAKKPDSPQGPTNPQDSNSYKTYWNGLDTITAGNTEMYKMYAVLDEGQKSFSTYQYDVKGDLEKYGIKYEEIDDGHGYALKLDASNATNESDIQITITCTGTYGGKTSTSTKTVTVKPAGTQSSNSNNSSDGIKDAITNVQTALENSDNKIPSTNGDMHTEFGMDSNGDIVFQETNTKNNFDFIVTKLLGGLDSGTKSALGGYEGIRRLVQAAWITTYNSYNSSTSHNVNNFVAQVYSNLDKILTSIKNYPMLLDLYVGHTAYADKSLTDNLKHYGTNDTIGNDQIINYKGSYTKDGILHLGGQDDQDYQRTMSDLLGRLINKYGEYLGDSVIRELFLKAQQNTMNVAVDNENDCPYGTGNNGGYVEDTTKDWGGKDNRKGDGFDICMKELVQLILYQFDKLLYNEVANYSTNAEAIKTNLTKLKNYEYVINSLKVLNELNFQYELNAHGDCYVLEYKDTEGKTQYIKIDKNKLNKTDDISGFVTGDGSKNWKETVVSYEYIIQTKATSTRVGFPQYYNIKDEYTIKEADNIIGKFDAYLQNQIYEIIEKKLPTVYKGKLIISTPQLEIDYSVFMTD